MRQLGGRRLGLGLGGVAMVVALWAGLAWACTPGAFLEANPDSAAVGSTVRLTGSQFTVGQVQIYLEPAQGGPERLLWQGHGPSIDANVVVPLELAPGPYVLNGRSADGPGRALAVLTVNEPSGATTRTEAPDEGPGQPPTPQNQGAADPATPEPAAGQAAPAEAGTSAAAGTAPAPATGTPTSAARPAPRASAGATAPAGAGTVAAAAEATPAPAVPGPVVAPGTATADLWSGFADSAGAGRRPAGPGLTDSVPIPSGTDPAAWVALLGGLTALGGVVAAATFRRRRAVPANAHN